MKNVSTGFGLCVLGLGIAAWPVLDRLMPQANAVGIGTTAVTAVAAAATAQGAPTIVWYGVAAVGYPDDRTTRLFRAWSDGKVEYKECKTDGSSWPCAIFGGGCGWVLANNPAQGLTFDADLNFDEAVDGVDLGMMLAKWGPAPRNPVPPSDCPLALINP